MQLVIATTKRITKKVAAFDRVQLTPERRDSQKEMHKGDYDNQHTLMTRGV